MKKLRFPLLILLGLMIGLRLYNWNARVILGDPLPMPLGVGASVVLSGSMEPALSVGDLLILAEQEEYQVGDMVVYRSGKSTVVHRLLEQNGDRIIAKGDANNVADAPVPLSDVKAKVILAIPMLGWLLSSLSTPLGTLALIVIAVLFLEGSSWEEKDRHQQENEQLKEEIRKLMEELQE